MAKAETPEHAHPVAAYARDVAELRHLTVLFSDLVDSTVLTSGLGPERYRELLRDYRERCAKIFVGHGGYVAQYFGDGTLVYFGYPKAHEDNARRAVMAALEVLASIERLRAAFGASGVAGLNVRVAIHTGTVVVGDIHSETTGESMAIVGNAPNIVARLQNAAEPGKVIISRATYGLVSHQFACTALGPQVLKGVAGTVVAYRVDAALPVRFGSRLRKNQLVGRDPEARVLASAWRDALGGRGRTVLVRGEAGVGKSALIFGLLAEAERSGARQVALQCSSIYQNKALHPVVEFLVGLFGHSPGQTTTERIARIRETILTRNLDPNEYVPLFASFLDIPMPGADGAQSYALQEEREKIKLRLGDWVIHIAERQPVLLIVEDLHWADPSTIELFSELLPRLSASRVLVALSAREEFPVESLGPAQRIDVSLRRLDRADALTMIRSVASGRALSAEMLAALEIKTDGVPLYIEEMTRAVVEATLDEAPGAASCDVAVPATLSDSLAARIGRVAVSRELLEVIATLGRDFDFTSLAAVWQQDPVPLRADLDKLVDAQLLTETEDATQTRYSFRHGLLQETLYQSLLTSRRRSLHASIATALLTVFPRAVDDRPELIAHHYLAAGQGPPALPFLKSAASVAMRRSAHVEASRYLRAGLEVVQAMPDEPGCRRLEAELLLSLGVTLSAGSGYASEEVGQVFGRARDIARSLDPAANLFPVLHGLYRFYYVRAELGSALELSGEMLSIAYQQEGTALLVEAHRAAGNCCFNRGRFEEAERHLATALSHYSPDAHFDHRYKYGLDPFIGASSIRALNSWLRGHRSDATMMARAAVDRADGMEHPYTLAWALSYSALIESLNDDLDKLRAAADRLIHCADQHRFPFWRMVGLMSLGWWTHRSGNGAERGIALLREGLAGWERMGSIAYASYYKSLLARALLHDGDVDEAAHVIEDALAVAELHDDVWWTPELRRLRAISQATVRPGSA